MRREINYSSDGAPVTSTYVQLWTDMFLSLFATASAMFPVARWRFLASIAMLP